VALLTFVKVFTGCDAWRRHNALILAQNVLL
jgi:hypothetical protein